MTALRRIVDERLDHAPDEVALTDGVTALTWPELGRVIARAADGLQSLTPGPQHRVAVLARNSTETVLTHAAAMVGGLSAVPVSPHLTAGEIEHLLNSSGASTLVAGPETLDVSCRAASATDVRTVVAWRAPQRPGVLDWQDMLASGSEEAVTDHLPPLPPLMFTSGTTGRPKPVVQPPTTFPGGETVGELLDRLRANPLAGIGPHLVVGPLHHTGPLTAVRLLLAGTPLVVLPRFDAEAILLAIQQHRVAASVMVPTHFSRLLALPQEVRDRYDVSSLRQVVHTGAACPVPLKRRMLDWWGPVLSEAYGATEVGTTNSIEATEWLERPGSVGRAVPPYEVLILDEAGSEVPPGVAGRLCFRDTTGRGLVYADPVHNTCSDLPPGVFTLGEVGYVDTEGYVYITDRSADLVVSGGVNIYPAEAEAALTSLPGVVDAAAFGAVHAEMGEELRALVVVDDPALTPQRLLEQCRGRLASYKCPRVITLVDTLPRTAMGKLDKRALRDAHGGGVAVSRRAAR